MEKYIKARMKATGEVVEVQQDGTMSNNCGAYLTSGGIRVPGSALEFEKYIDWEQRRYELVKAAMQGYTANSAVYDKFDDVEFMLDAIKDTSIKLADEMIKQLKGK